MEALPHLPTAASLPLGWMDASEEVDTWHAVADYIEMRSRFEADLPSPPESELAVGSLHSSISLASTTSTMSCSSSEHDDYHSSPAEEAAAAAQRALQCIDDVLRNTEDGVQAKPKTRRGTRAGKRYKANLLRRSGEGVALAAQLACQYPVVALAPPPPPPIHQHFLTLQQQAALLYGYY